MAHPAAGRRLHTAQQTLLLFHPDRNPAVLALRGFLHAAAQQEGGQLHAVADAQHRDAGVIQRRIDLGGIRIMHAGRTAGEDDALRPVRQDFRQGRVPGDYFGIDVAFPDPAGDQLRILAAEIKDQDFLVLRHRNLHRWGTAQLTPHLPHNWPGPLRKDHPRHSRARLCSASRSRESCAPGRDSTARTAPGKGGFPS